MTYLTGKTFKRLSDGKSGTIIGEPSREACDFYENNDSCTPIVWKTYVAVLWNDGTMTGAVDVEELRIILPKPGR